MSNEELLDDISVPSNKKRLNARGVNDIEARIDRQVWNFVVNSLAISHMFGESCAEGCKIDSDELGLLLASFLLLVVVLIVVLTTVANLSVSKGTHVLVDVEIKELLMTMETLEILYERLSCLINGSRDRGVQVNPPGLFTRNRPDEKRLGPEKALHDVALDMMDPLQILRDLLKNLKDGLLVSSWIRLVLEYTTEDLGNGIVGTRRLGLLCLFALLPVADLLISCVDSFTI
mmetsp:Transcript_17424/g.35985  ORF Transcript_17424/g.35985 Transcript_17424/m.35985 type:complete len:232 (+) Transcript_17424:4221-4916(+)